MKCSQTIIVTSIAGIFLVSTAPVVLPDSSLTPTAISSDSVPVPNPSSPNQTPQPPCEECVTVKMYLWLKAHDLAYLLLDWKSTVNEWKEDKKKLEEEIKEWREPERMDKKIKPDEMRENIRLVKDELWEMRLRIGRMVIRLKKMEMRMGHMDVETILGKKDALEYEHDKKELMHMSLDLLLLQDDIRIMRTWDDEVFNSDLRYHLKVAQMQRMGKNGRKMGYHVLVDGPLVESNLFYQRKVLPHYELVDDDYELWRVIPTKEVLTEPHAWKRLQRIKYENRVTQRLNKKRHKINQLKRKLLLGQIG